jgi:hypothetical protein
VATSGGLKKKLRALCNRRTVQYSAILVEHPIPHSRPRIDVSSRQRLRLLRVSAHSVTLAHADLVDVVAYLTATVLSPSLHLHHHHSPPSPPHTRHDNSTPHHCTRNASTIHLPHHRPSTQDLRVMYTQLRKMGAEGTITTNLEKHVAASGRSALVRYVHTHMQRAMQ